MFLFRTVLGVKLGKRRLKILEKKVSAINLLLDKCMRLKLKFVKNCNFCFDTFLNSKHHNSVKTKKKNGSFLMISFRFDCREAGCFVKGKNYD